LVLWLVEVEVAAALLLAELVLLLMLPMLPKLESML
jgi:hypothetical protein